jgi:hypothetical protein
LVAPVQVGVTLTVEPGQMWALVPVVGHVMPFAHAPQSCVPPQPLPMTPQYWPPIGVHVIFLQVGSLHTFGS